MEFDKSPLTFQEQIKLLKKRGLLIPDENNAIEILSTHGR